MTSKNKLIASGILLFILLIIININIIDIKAQLEDIKPPTNDLNEEITEEQKIDQLLDLKEGKASANNVVLTRKAEDDSTKITFNQGGILKLNGYTYSKLTKIENQEPEIHVDKNGKIIKAFFKTQKEQTIVLGNEILENLPVGSEVSYKDGKATIKQPKGTGIRIPKKTIDNKQGESVFYFEYDGSNEFLFSTGDKFKLEQLGYEKGKIFFDSNTATIGRVGDSIQVLNPSKVRTYIDFDGEPDLNYDSAYVSIKTGKDSSIVIGMNAKGVGPSYLFSSESDFIKDIPGERDNFAVQVLSSRGEKSYVAIIDRSPDKIANIVTLNGYVINDDGKSVYYHPEKKQLLIRGSNIIKGFGMSQNYLPFEIKSYRSENNDYNNLMGVFKNKNNIMIVGNDGAMPVGPNPRFIRIESSGYGGGEKGLKKGASNLISYNEPATLRSFTRFTGIKINDRVGIKSDRIRMLMDVFGNAPTKMAKHIKELQIMSGNTGFAGRAGSRAGLIELNYGQGGVDPGTAIHEAAHILDFESGKFYNRGNTFRRFGNLGNQWNAIGGSRTAHSESYGAKTRAEDISTFVQNIYRNSWRNSNSGIYFRSWNQGLNQGYSQYKKVRAKLAIVYWNDFITREQMTRVYNLAGLPSDDASLLKYFNEAKR